MPLQHRKVVAGRFNGSFNVGCGLAGKARNKAARHTSAELIHCGVHRRRRSESLSEAVGLRQS
jgi:hypothetical protein